MQKKSIRWRTLVKLCGKPQFLGPNPKPQLKDPAQLVTVFHAEDSFTLWGECGNGHCNVFCRVAFPKPIPAEHRDKIVVGVAAE
jgi:hypothetical protein